MTLTELRYIVALDQERHFGRAAERCFVSQPTLSVAVRKLEEQLGVTLFERIRGEARPTAIGARVVEQARRVLDEAGQIKGIAQQGKNELSGVLRVGAIFTVGPYLFPHLVPALHEAAPEMPLVISENYTAQLAEQLKHNEIDAALIALPFSHPGVETLALYDEPFVIALPKKHAWAKKKSIEGTALVDQELLLLGPGNCFRDQVLAACPQCRQMELEGSRALAGGSLETIRHMVASGLGVTVLPQTAVAARDDALLVTRPFAGSPPQRRIAMAWRRSFPRPRAIQALVAAVHADLPKGVRAVAHPGRGAQWLRAPDLCNERRRPSFRQPEQGSEHGVSRDPV